MVLTNSWQTVASQDSTAPGGMRIRYYINARLASQDIANNVSYIDVQLGSQILAGKGSSYNCEFSCSYCPTVSCSASELWYFQNEIITSATNQQVGHNNDGTKNISFSAICNAIGLGFRVDLSGSADLPTIPRASNVTASDGKVGSTTYIMVSKFADSFTSTVRYQFGSLSGTIVDKDSNWLIPFNIPTSFYGQMPNERTKQCIIYLDTYSGNTKIGDTKSATFNVTTDEWECRPQVSISVKDTGGTTTDSSKTTVDLTGDNSKIIVGYSKAQVTYSVTPRNSASIKSRNINGSSLSSNSGTKTYDKTSTGVFTLSATDSRDYSNSVTSTNEYINYLPLSITPNFYRKEPTTGSVSLEFKGNYWNNNFGKVQNTLEIKWEYKEANSTTWLTGGTLALNTHYTIKNGVVETIKAIDLTNPKPDGINPNFNYQKQYDFRLLFKDKLVNDYRTNRVTEGKPVYWWNGIGFYVEKPLHLASGNEVLDYDVVSEWSD